MVSVSADELFQDPGAVAAAVTATLDRAGAGLTAQWRVTEVFRRSGLGRELVDSLVSPDPAARASAAQLCGAIRLSEAVLWIGDLLGDPNIQVREAAIRALGRLGGRRAVDTMMAAVDRVPMYRLAISLSQAASDIEIETLIRQPKSERAAVATVLACGLRRDSLRVPPLLGIAHDRRWPKRVRLAACLALGMIGDGSVADGLGKLATGEPDVAVKAAAARAQRRLQRVARRQRS